MRHYDAFMFFLPLMAASLLIIAGLNAAPLLTHGHPSDVVEQKAPIERPAICKELQNATWTVVVTLVDVVREDGLPVYVGLTPGKCKIGLTWVDPKPSPFKFHDKVKIEGITIDGTPMVTRWVLLNADGSESKIGSAPEAN